jgi:hypothetical protein
MNCCLGSIPEAGYWSPGTADAFNPPIEIFSGRAPGADLTAALDWACPGSSPGQAPHQVQGHVLAGATNSSGPRRPLDDGGECVGQVVAEQLLDQVEGIEKRAVFDDTPRAQRKEIRNIELQQIPYPVE